MSKITKMFSGQEYEIYEAGLTKRQATDSALRWKRGHMNLVRGEHRSCRRRFYARAVPYEGKYAVFVRID
jgi:hypothetical protein